MIKEEHLGTKVTISRPNGTTWTGTVTQDPEQYEFYKSIGLDYMFEQDEKTLLIMELEAFGVKVNKRTSVKKLKEKLDDIINKGYGKYEYSVNTKGEKDA